MKVKDLAFRLRVTPEYVNAIESGKKKPSSRLIRDYSEALDIDEEIILRFSKESAENTPFEALMLSLLKMIVE